jgi:hypothetical protein
MQPIRAENIIGNFTHVEAWREIGTEDNPDFEANWANYTTISAHNTAAFFKDPFGMVHIKGLVTHTVGGAATSVFYLPEGYRPVKRGIFATIGTGDTLCRVDVLANGGVYLVAGDASSYLAIDVISFRVV